MTVFNLRVFFGVPPDHDPVQDGHDDDVVEDGGGGIVPGAGIEVVGEEDEGQQARHHHAQGVAEIQHGANIKGRHGLLREDTKFNSGPPL